MKHFALSIVILSLVSACGGSDYSEDMVEEAAEEAGGPTRHFEPAEPPPGEPDDDAATSTK